MMRRLWPMVALGLALAAAPPTAGQEREAETPGPSAVLDAPSIHITSPMGRTGVVGKVRIVAQVNAPPGTMLSPMDFYVDGELVGTVDDGPPYAVEWTDENPFEAREIVAQAADGLGRLVRDRVRLPPFELTDLTEVTSILLEVGVYDAHNRPVASLAPSSFVVREDDVEQNIDQVGSETLPSTFVLLVDNSQSMSRRMDFVKLAAEQLAGTLHDRDRVVVAPFNAHLGTITGPTNDGPTIAEAVDAMHAHGGTAILDSLLDATKLLQGVDGRRAVILITDGYDENSSATVESVLQSAGAAGVTVYVVAIGGVAGISLKGEDLLRRIALETGGRVFVPIRDPDLVAVAGRVAADAHTRYLISYTPRNQRRDGTWRAVSVDVPEGYRSRTRAGYFAPAPPPIRPILEFTVTSASREYVNVSVDDLDVVEDGVRQTVDTFQEAVDPVAIVLALDASGSMKKSAEQVRETAREFAQAVRPEDQLALLTFADVPTFAQALDTGRKAVLRGIDSYTPDGGTALYDALWNSLAHLRTFKGRHAVVVLTDGRDEDNPGTGPGSVHSLDQVMDLLKEVGATVFSIGLGANVDRQVLEMLAQQSSGEAYFPTDASALGRQFDLIVENLRRRYVLSYTSTNSSHDGAWRTVRIGTHASGLIVKTNGGYFAPEK